MSGITIKLSALNSFLTWLYYEGYIVRQVTPEHYFGRQYDIWPNPPGPGNPNNPNFGIFRTYDGDPRVVHTDLPEGVVQKYVDKCIEDRRRVLNIMTLGLFFRKA